MTDKLIGCVQHDCDQCKARDAELDRMRSAMRNAIYTDNSETVVHCQKRITELEAEVEAAKVAASDAGFFDMSAAEVIKHQTTVLALVEQELEQAKADVERLTLEKKAAAMNYEAVIEGLKAELITALGQEFEHEPENEPLVSLIGVAKATIAELEEMNEQLREQNIIVGKVCGDLEAEVERLKQDQLNKHNELEMHLDQIDHLHTEMVGLRGALREADKHCPVNSTAEILVRAALASGAAPKGEQA